EGSRHLEKCVFLASAPERQHLDGTGTALRRLRTDRTCRQTGGNHGERDSQRNEPSTSLQPDPPPCGGREAPPLLDPGVVPLDEIHSRTMLAPLWSAVFIFVRSGSIRF